MAIGTVPRSFKLEQLDVLTKKTSQLDALLQMTYGGAGDAFRDVDTDAQDNYLWACSELACEIKDLVKKL